MWYNYVERMIEYERRREEDQRLYAMLAATNTARAPFQGLRVALGHGMMRLGARLAGESIYLPMRYSADKCILSQNN
jgi:hypothetical protein